MLNVNNFITGCSIRIIPIFLKDELLFTLFRIVDICRVIAGRVAYIYRESPKKGYTF